MSDEIEEIDVTSSLNDLTDQERLLNVFDGITDRVPDRERPQRPTEADTKPLKDQIRALVSKQEEEENAAEDEAEEVYRDWKVGQKKLESRGPVIIDPLNDFVDQGSSRLLQLEEGLQSMKKRILAVLESEAEKSIEKAVSGRRPRVDI